MAKICVNLFLFPFGIYLVVELLSEKLGISSSLLYSVKLFTKVVVSDFHPPPAMYESFIFLLPCQHLVCQIFNFNCSLTLNCFKFSYCHVGFNLHSSDE